MRLVFQIAGGIVVAGLAFTVIGVACTALFLGGASRAVDDALSRIDRTECARRATEIAARHAALTPSSTFQQTREAILSSDDGTALARC